MNMVEVIKITLELLTLVGNFQFNTPYLVKLDSPGSLAEDGMQKGISMYVIKATLRRIKF